jgi:isocitrate/isopropylmalate dehydrogenase
MMLEYLGQDKAARKLEAAISAVLVEGKDLTYDVFRDNGDPEWETKAVSTLDMARAVARKILPDYDKFDADISAKAKEMCAWEHLPQ